MPICVHSGCVKGHVVFVHSGCRMLPRKDDTNSCYDFSIKSKNTFSEHQLAGWPLPRTTHAACSLLMSHGNYDLRWVFASNLRQPPAIFFSSSIVCVDKRQSLAVHHIISIMELSRHFVIMNYFVSQLFLLLFCSKARKSPSISIKLTPINWNDSNWIECDTRQLNARGSVLIMAAIRSQSIRPLQCNVNDLTSARTSTLVANI